jgi:SWI/SNF-related matrix-associated actin-dependent regulator 1 of chromatin subfamily A
MISLCKQSDSLLWIQLEYVAESPMATRIARYLAKNVDPKEWQVQPSADQQMTIFQMSNTIFQHLSCVQGFNASLPTLPQELEDFVFNSELVNKEKEICERKNRHYIQMRQEYVFNVFGEAFVRGGGEGSVTHKPLQKRISMFLVDLICSGYLQSYHPYLESLLPERAWSLSLPLQQRAVEFAWHRGGRALLADDMGLGKTFQALLIAALYPNQWPILILAPALAKANWPAECVSKLGIPKSKIRVIQSIKDSETLFSDAAPSLNKSKKRKRVQNGEKEDAYQDPVTLEAPAYLVYFATYDICVKSVAMQTRMQKVTGANILIVDECHYCKNIASQRTQSVLKISQQFKHVLLLSGTLSDKPEQLFPQLLMVQPAILPRFWLKKNLSPKTLLSLASTKENDLGEYLKEQGNCEFTYALRWCRPRIETYFAGGQRRAKLNMSGAQNLQELYAIGSTLFWIRRLKKDELASQLKEKQRILIYKDVDPQHQEMTQKIMGKMRQVKLNNRPDQYRVLWGELFNSLGAIKQEMIVTYLTEYLKTEHKDFPQRKTIIFAHNQVTMRYIEQLLLDYVGKEGYMLIQGETLPKQRAERVERFQTHPPCRIALLSLKAAAAGMNLQAASTVIFTQLLFGPEYMMQAEDRAYRLGQTQNVQCRYLLARGTLDEVLIQMIQRKSQMGSHMLDGCPLTLEMQILEEEEPTV